MRFCFLFYGSIVGALGLLTDTVMDGTLAYRQAVQLSLPLVALTLAKMWRRRDAVKKEQDAFRMQARKRAKEELLRQVVRLRIQSRW